MINKEFHKDEQREWKVNAQMCGGFRQLTRSLRACFFFIILNATLILASSIITLIPSLMWHTDWRKRPPSRRELIKRHSPAGASLGQQTFLFVGITWFPVSSWIQPGRGCPAWWSGPRPAHNSHSLPQACGQCTGIHLYNTTHPKVLFKKWNGVVYMELPT